MEVTLEESKERVSQFVEQAKKEGLRITPQRLEVFKEVATATEHPDVETIFSSIRARMPTISLDTVYRTLWWLKDAGLITTLGIKRDTTRFDPNLRPHHHFICVRCGKAEDFYDTHLDSLKAPDSTTKFGEVHGLRVEVRGICKFCLSKATFEDA